jgi:predicted DsbA family dithiol-disulfide isomerase
MSDGPLQDSTTIEVFADITCPFTHVGLKRVIEHIAELERPATVHVRAWPLEWVNGAGLEVEAVEAKAKALTQQLGVDDFSGLDHDQWPSSTVGALALAAGAYAVDMATGLAVSVELRRALFEQGRNIGDRQVLAEIAANHGLSLPEPDDVAAVQADYDEGCSRGVSGSPHFFVGQDNFFCPALDLGHDADGNLTARLDTEGLAAFFARIDG